MSAISDSLKKYNKLKRFSDYVHGKLRRNAEIELLKIDMLKEDIYTKSDMWEKLDAISKCSSLVELRHYENGETKVHNANYCHNPVVCPMCADRVSKRRRAIFSNPIKKAVDKFSVNKYSPGWKKEYPSQYTGVYMATATIKDGKNLKERIDTLNESLKNFRKMGQKRNNDTRSQGEWSKVIAGISNTELKIGKVSGEWHVHAHFLIFTSAPLKYDLYSDTHEVEIEKAEGLKKKVTLSKFNYEWFLASAGEGINFDLIPIQYKREVHNKKCNDFAESVQAQSVEVLKYNTQLTAKKGTKILNPAQYVELIERRGTRRLFNTIGLFRCDKRNPDALISMSERELERLQYVDKVDNMSYDIYSSLWQNGGTYQEPMRQEKAIFSDSDEKNTRFVDLRRRIFKAQTAIYQGSYRKQRNYFLKNRHLWKDKLEFEEMIDSLKGTFRTMVSSLWEKFKDKDFLPEFIYEFDFGVTETYAKKVLPSFA